MDNMSLFVRKAMLTTLEPIREAFVIQSQQVQDCSLQIVHGNRIFNRPVADLVRTAVGVALLYPAAGHPNRKCLVVIASYPQTKLPL